MQISKACNNIKVSGDCLKCNVMYYLCQFLVLNYLSKMREKEPLECRRMHIWALKTQKLPGPLSGPWTLAAKGSLRLHDSASLHRQLSASDCFFKFWGWSLMQRITRKGCLESGRMHIWTLKTPKLPGPLSGPRTPGRNGARFAHATLLCYVGKFHGSGPGPPPDQILDPHLLSPVCSLCLIDPDWFIVSAL